MDEKWRQGRFGYGVPDYDNPSWGIGNAQRMDEERQKREAESKALRERLDANNKAFQDGLKRSSPDFSFWPPTPSLGSADGSLSTSSAPSTAIHTSYGASASPTFPERLWAFVTAPLRWLWALVVLTFRAGFWLLKLAAVLAVAGVVLAVSQNERATPAAGTPPPSAPIASPSVQVSAPVVPWFGIGLQDLSAQNTAALHLAAGNAAYVSSVADNSPASRANLIAGDVIYAVGGYGVSGANGTLRALRAATIGQPIAIDFIRGGRTFRTMPVPERRAR